MLWTRIKRTTEVPNLALLDPIAQFQELIVVGETLFENKIIADYTIFEGFTLAHNHADVTIFVDSTLKQVRIGTDIIYQCPVARSFIFAFAGSLTLPAGVNLDLVKYVSPSGVILFDVDSITQTSTLLFRNSAAGITTASPTGIRFYVLQY